jgi:hypothetical protein
MVRPEGIEPFRVIGVGQPSDLEKPNTARQKRYLGW